MTPDGTKLAGRLVALAIGGVVVQTTAVSQLPIAGANADLAPLLVMAVGLLCGSLAGGSFGFGVGLFRRGARRRACDPPASPGGRRPASRSRGRR